MSPPVGDRRHPATATVVAIVLNVLVAAGIGVLRTVNATAGQRHAEGMLPTVAMVCAFLAPAAIALVGLALDRPVCSCAAGITCLPVAVVSIAAFPLLLAGALYLAGFAQAAGAGARFSLLDAVVAGGVPIPVVAGLFVLVTRTRPYQYTTATGHEGGDAFTRANAVLCIALAAAAVLLAAALARAGSHARSHATGTPVAP